MASKLKRFIQVGIIVRDMDKAIKNYEALGIGPWRLEKMDKSSFTDMTLNGEPSTMELLCAFCSCYGMEIELIQPLNDSPQMRWLEQHGPGIQHLSFLPTDGHDAMVAEAAKMNGGKPPFMHGKAPSVGMEFSYLDLTEELGMILEIHNEPEREKQPGHDF